jgi:hypothetical protein
VYEDGHAARYKFFAPCPSCLAYDTAHRIQSETLHDQKGYICQVPPEALNGDIVAVFYGCEVPHLLRPAREGHYKFVGNGYVHGIMYGEALGFPGLLAERY